jgi:hypothetical protein
MEGNDCAPLTDHWLNFGLLFLFGFPPHGGWLATPYSIVIIEGRKVLYFQINESCKLFRQPKIIPRNFMDGCSH